MGAAPDPRHGRGDGPALGLNDGRIRAGPQPDQQGGIDIEQPGRQGGGDGGVADADLAHGGEARLHG